MLSVPLTNRMTNECRCCPDELDPHDRFKLSPFLSCHPGNACAAPSVPSVGSNAKQLIMGAFKLIPVDVLPLVACVSAGAVQRATSS